ncbi:Leucine-rich repeat-containing N-terminal, plant-type [Dillenia turbinata]|uniref:Leucine-rich repeat-containing N-terminal, plant-type n=1 Tax=Dillenia turbinata TaxID=194707 RepID=A0AAN8WCC2_9MAGN
MLEILILLLLAPALVRSSGETFNDDVLGLIVFKAGISDPESKLSSWNEDDDTPCNWFGVKCDPTSSRVTELSLSSLSLSGHINKGLLRLQFLQTLSLSKNNFSGTLNPNLGNIKTIQTIDLSRNKLSGSIPDEFFQQCVSLREISLAENEISGPIPESLTSCSTLESVNFSSNQLSGSLPTHTWSLTELRVLDLSNNFLAGQVFEGVGNLYNLQEINLSRNRFYGNLPEDIGGCILLETIDFSVNSLSGNIPASMGNLSMCTRLDLHGNLFSGKFPHWVGELRNLEIVDLSLNRFSGPVPNSLGNLQLLKELKLFGNQFSGGLPSSMRDCLSLTIMDVSQNELTGNLPSWVFDLGLSSVWISGNKFSGSIELPPIAASYQRLQVLDLSRNAFSGGIPEGIGNFSSLQLLNMSTNSLEGDIPASIGELKSMDVLDLSNNRLNGSIPLEIGEAILLQELRLENNLLSGKIPTQIGKCSFLTYLDLSKNNLSGPLPNAMANLTNLQDVNLSFNNLSGSLPKELTNLSHLTSFNISHNHFEGELPLGGFFNTIPPSSVSSNPSLCGSAVNHSCPSVHPKPIVLNPNSSSNSPPGSSSANVHRKKIILSISSLIAIGAAVFIALGVVTITILNIHVRSKMSQAAISLSGGGDSNSLSPDANYGKLVMFSGDAEFVCGANSLLSKDCELGRGGFGAVYRTTLQDGRSVAIKKLSVSSLVKSQNEFEREIRQLEKAKHPNLVALEGYYWTPSLQLLIYEYISNGSLCRHLHEDLEGNFLSWNHRFNVILGSAKGLAHLHQMKVIHYNLKSSNVLIDSSGEAKIGDYGLVKLLPMLDRYVVSSKIQSALGYVAPEFACRTVKITEKCDVYGFGVLVLEIVTGKKPVEYMEDDVAVLSDMVRAALDEGRAEECIDRRLHGNFPVEEAIPIIKLGLICASQVPSSRPDMGEVVNILELIRCPLEGHEELE